MYKQKILDTLGPNHTQTVVFNPRVDGVRAIYTYEDDVYFIDDMDCPFDELPENKQLEVSNRIEKGQYKIDNTIQ